MSVTQNYKTITIPSFNAFLEIVFALTEREVLLTERIVVLSGATLSGSALSVAIRDETIAACKRSLADTRAMLALVRKYLENPK